MFLSASMKKQSALPVPSPAETQAPSLTKKQKSDTVIGTKIKFGGLAMLL